jgi:hypothetical protein
MKKISLLLATAVASITMAEASSFNGFYLGVQAGYTQKNVHDKVIQDSQGGGVAAEPGFINGAARERNNGALYGIAGGWGTTTTNSIYMGVEATIHNDTSNKNNTYNFKANDSSGPWPYKGEYRRGIAYGIAPRVGMVFANTWLGYAKFGIEVSRDKAIHQNLGGNIASPPGGAAAKYPSSPSYSSGAKRKIVFVPGIGLEKAFGKILTRIEYNYNVGANIRQQVQFVQDGYNVTEYQKINYTAHVLKVGVSYKF